MKLYIKLARLVEAYDNCIKSANGEWRSKHKEELESLVKEYMPSGGGIDNGTTLDFCRSTDEKLIFNTSFHHMNDVGMYAGWTEHTVTVRGSLADGFRLTISGKDRHQIKDYLHEVFYEALSKEVPEF